SGVGEGRSAGVPVGVGAGFVMCGAGVGLGVGVGALCGCIWLTRRGRAFCARPALETTSRAAAIAQTAARASARRTRLVFCTLISLILVLLTSSTRDGRCRKAGAKILTRLRLSHFSLPNESAPRASHWLRSCRGGKSGALLACSQSRRWRLSHGRGKEPFKLNARPGTKGRAFAQMPRGR
ncbi:MAG: hypothetical protein QOF02_3956, partial [Blastocatellia bacterium]|nr:hypothetical protein [Blastocatellia bacterium]